ncbi:MAG: heparinase II/III family protein [Sedimentisphaerales bacterium]|jgi:hypothetical protein|nr:heparinase II/III family protein [Sedimentisphaerales bacterium]
MCNELITLLWLVAIATAPDVAKEVDARRSALQDQLLARLEPNHPRILLTEQRLKGLKESAENDAVLRRYVADVLRQARSYLDARPLEYQKIGPRLLHVSRACLDRVYALGFARRWTGQGQYADKAIEQMLTVCGFPDWNPSHFLDTAEMSHAVGIGYDWLYTYMDEQTRDRIRTGLIRHGLEPGLQAYKDTWWVRSEFNWNQVCNGGLIIGALAVADTDPCYAQVIIPAAIKSLPSALRTYGPDGSWPEGPGYWGYATSYTAYGMAALMTACGSDAGLLKTDGLSKAGMFSIYTTGPTGLYLNFADVGERSRRGPMACMFWLAEVYDMPLYAWSEHQVLVKGTASPQHVIWYVPTSREAPRLDLDRYFRGPVEIAVFRSSWEDPNALFVGIKAGYNQVNHGHLDLGNFELDALGVRWARDLGSDNYNLPGYWESGRDGRRWQYYRLRSASHNVPTIDGHDQDPYGKASFTKTSLNTEAPYAILDLTSAYRPYVEKAVRGISLMEGRRAVLVQDEFVMSRHGQITWAMTTDAAITVSEHGMAILEHEGRQLIARILWPDSASFAIASAQQEQPQAQNKGVRRLLARVDSGPGKVMIAILLSPVWPDGGDVRAVPVRPLDQW